MDVKKIQYKPGTMVLDKETGELLKVRYFEGNQVFFVKYNDGSDAHWDYIGFLGSIYIKTKAGKLLYGRKKSV